MRRLVSRPLYPLDRATWSWRHRLLVRLGLAQGLVLLVASFWLAEPGPDMVLHALPLVLIALAAAMSATAPRVLRSGTVAVALFAQSALLVHLGDGTTALHFHFFVMLVLLGLYEDARPLVVGVAFVLLHHTGAGLLAPDQVYGDDVGRNHVLAWALVHGAFVLAEAAALVVLRRAGESQRQRSDAVLERERAALAILRDLSHQVASEPDPRQAVVDGICRLTDASFSALSEVRGGGTAIEVTAATLPAFIGDRVPVDGVSGRSEVLRTRAPIFSTDAQGDTRFTSRLVEASGVRCVLLQPVWVDGAVEAVLSVGWDDPLPSLAARETTLVALGATEAALALHRHAETTRLEAQALTDPLTGCGNRRRWEHALAEAFDHGDQPLSVALLDLNEFKRLNDTHGHDAGDEHLQAVAAAWARRLRPSDVLARIGGDEFGVLLNGSDARAAALVATRLRDAVPGLAGAAVGTATRQPGESLEELLRRADVALYADKANARTSAPITLLARRTS